MYITGAPETFRSAITRPSPPPNSLQKPPQKEVPPQFGMALSEDWANSYPSIWRIKKENPVLSFSLLHYVRKVLKQHEKEEERGENNWIKTLLIYTHSVYKGLPDESEVENLDQAFLEMPAEMHDTYVKFVELLLPGIKSTDKDTVLFLPARNLHDYKKSIPETRNQDLQFVMANALLTAIVIDLINKRGPEREQVSYAELENLYDAIDQNEQRYPIAMALPVVTAIQKKKPEPGKKHTRLTPQDLLPVLREFREKFSASKQD